MKKDLFNEKTIKELKIQIDTLKAEVEVQKNRIKGIEDYFTKGFWEIQIDNWWEKKKQDTSNLP